jgi:8-oxo-dGTP pyrophosphatase MutT (NUDIX family)
MGEDSVRPAARVVLLDPADAVLLLSGQDPSRPQGRRFWFVPGGGAEPGEDIRDAARREAYEEVGGRLGDLGPVVWYRHTRFAFDGRWYDQHESFFVVRTERFSARATALTELEQRAVTGSRWWPLAELAAATAAADAAELVYPPRLAPLIRAWVASGPPATPLAIA